MADTMTDRAPLDGRSKVASRALAWPLAVVLAAVYVIVLYQYSALLFQDYANHLARAVVLADLWFHHGSHFGEAFQFQFMAYPYIAADLLLAPAVELLGPQGATFLWTALAVLSLPCAMLFYLRATDASRNAPVFIFLLALYLSTDSFFFLGFINFRFAVALTVAALALALALAQILRRRYSPMLFMTYCLTIALGFLMHLAYVVFAAAAIGASGLFRLRRRATSLGRELCLLLPIGLAALWYVLSPSIYPAAREVIPAHFLWGGLHAKIRQLDWDVIRFNEPVDVVFAAAFLLLLFWATRYQLRRPGVLQYATLELPLLAVVFSRIVSGDAVAFRRRQLSRRQSTDILARACSTVVRIPACRPERSERHGIARRPRRRDAAPGRQSLLSRRAAQYPACLAYAVPSPPHRRTERRSRAAALHGRPCALAISVLARRNVRDLHIRPPAGHEAVLRCAHRPAYHLDR
jgi:hypothetical protein